MAIPDCTDRTDRTDRTGGSGLAARGDRTFRNPLSMLAMRSARWSATHPWRATLGWLALVAVAVALAALVPTVEASDADYRIGESGRAEQLIDEADLGQPDSELVLVQRRGGGSVEGGGTGAVAESLAGDLSSLASVTAVEGPTLSDGGDAYLLSAHLRSDEDDVSTLTALTDAAQVDHPSLLIRQAGEVSTDDAIDERVASDLGAAEGISLPVTLGLMLLAFGALIAAGIPVLLAATSVAATIGLMAPLSHLVHAETTVASMIVLIGMAVGVDYSLFYLKREREERARGATTLEAVDIAAQTSGHAILVSGAAVMASMTGLYVMGGATFNSLATGSILVVAVAVLGSMTVLPALLARLGRWVDRPRVPLVWRLNARIGRGGVARRLLLPVVRRPVAALVLSGLVVAGLALPALGMRLHSSNLDTLPASIPEVATLRAVSADYPSEGATATVVVRSDASPARVEGALRDLSRTSVASGDFVDSGASPTVSADGETTRLELAMPFPESDERVDEALRTLRDDLVPAAFDGLDGAEAVVGGGAAESLDYADRQSTRLPLIIGFVLLLTTMMMLGTFRSVPIALLSLALNAASVSVAFGLLALVFQHGWGADLLGFTSPGFVIDWIPLFVLVVLVGLSMDYHVFVVSRIREHVAAGLPTRLAVQRGIADTAGVVTSAASVMVSVFAIFATLSMLEMKMMGVGLCAAILLDATLVRLVMLPAALILLGDRAWWPARTGFVGPVGSVTPSTRADSTLRATPVGHDSVRW